MCLTSIFQCILVDMTMNNARIGELSTSQKLDGANNDMWKRNIQYPLNKINLQKHLTVGKFLPSDKDKDGNLIDTTIVQYQESLLAYLDWSNEDCRAYFAMLYCMQNDFIREFEACPMADDMWNKLKIHFRQTSETRLCTLLLKWMQYKMNSSRPMAKHLRTMSAMVHDLKIAGKDIYEVEQVLNVIRAILDEPEHWDNAKLVLICSDHLKTFSKIQSHLEM